MKSRELRSTCSKDLLSAATYSESRPSWLAFTNKWSQGPDTSETPTRNSTSQNCHPEKPYRPLGTESSFSWEDLHSLKSRRPTLSLTPLSWTSSQWPPSLTQETPTSWSALLFALTWVAFQFLILEPTRDGCACAMVQSTTSSEESDKVQPKTTYHISTTPSTDQSSALKNKSSLMSHQHSSMCEKR